MNIELVTIIVILMIMLIITFVAYHINNFEKLRIIYYTAIMSFFILIMAILSFVTS